MSERYGRQLVLSGWSGALQSKLAGLKAVVPGTGTRSEVCALYLVGAGVGILAAEPRIAALCRRLDSALSLEALPSAHLACVRLGELERPRIDTGDPVRDGAAEAAALLEAQLE